jgi:putative oxidoreductase
MTSLSAWEPRVLSILRIVTALCFLEHGTQKVFNFPAGEHHGVSFTSLAGVSGLFELVGGALLLLGLFTRPVAFILSGMMAYAYWAVHAAQGPYPVNNGGDAAILYCFVFFYLIFAGPGPWSVDAMRRRR